MIAKAVKGKGFRGALDYDLTKEKGRMIDSNMAGETPRQLAAEFGEIRKLRPNLGKAVLHVSLAAAHGEALSDAQWRDIGQHYLRGMGLTNNQYVMTRHTDTEHEHIHILANRITHSGTVVSDGNDYQRQESIMREIEQKYGLQQVAPSRDAERKAPTKGEIEQALRTGEASTRQKLQQLCDGAKRDCHDISSYQARLEAAGVALIPVVQLDGAKLSGLSYRLDGITMKGSDLGKSYSPAGLAKQGVTYEQNRDFAAIRASIEREAARVFGRPDRDSTTEQNRERGGASSDTGAVSASDGRTDGRNTADAGRDRPQEQGTGRDIQAPDNGISNELQRRDGRGSASRSEPESSRQPDGMAALRPDHRDGLVYGGARERILALHQPTDRQEQPRRGTGGRIPETRDRSLEAIEKQVNALGVAWFEIGVREAKTGLMMNREWRRDELLDSVAWLKRMNAKGNDIYLRPAGEHGLVLVDDLNAAALARMKKDGYAPAAIIETSPSNYQAWVKLADTPVSAEARALAAKGLAQKYGGDPNSADSHHYGRLAGFTNQKPKYNRDGQQPYVLARVCSGEAATSAETALERIAQHIDKEMSGREREKRLEALKTANTAQSRRFDPVQEYQRQAKNLLTRYGDDIDLSRMDWMIATSMASDQQGRWPQKDIERAILECSPNIESRKAGHIEDYAQRTAAKAWQAPEVVQHRQEKARQAEKGRDNDGPSHSR